MTTQNNIIVRSRSAPTQLAPALPPPCEGIEPPPPNLSLKQHAALELLIKGVRVIEIADQIGVDKGTIHRWRATDPNFIAALNRWRGDMQAETRDRLLSISAEATDSVKDRIVKGDGRLGYKVLERMGCLETGSDKPVDPYAVFGISLNDEAARRPIDEGFARLSPNMTPEQRRRSHELLALGVVTENRRLGRESSLDLLEMAGLLDESEAARAAMNIDAPEEVQTSSVHVFMTTTGTREKGASQRMPSETSMPQMKVCVVSSPKDYPRARLNLARVTVSDRD